MEGVLVMRGHTKRKDQTSPLKHLKLQVTELKDISNEERDDINRILSQLGHLTFVSYHVMAYRDE